MTTAGPVTSRPGSTSGTPTTSPTGSPPTGRDGWPVEPGRYRLIAARACPWANRSIIVRRLLGLEPVISMGLCGPTHDERSWTFDLDPGGRDPVLGYERLQEAFLARDPRLPTRHHGAGDRRRPDEGRSSPTTSRRSRSTSPPSGRRTTATARPTCTRRSCATRWTTSCSAIYTEVNNGVYRCGFAGSQRAYDKAFDRLFTALDWLEERLADQRYLMGDTITEADVRLFTTLARFDAVYHGHFKCNRQKLTEFPVLWAYARDLFQTPGFGDTIDFPQIKEHYYVVHKDINPTQIIPVGPGHVGLADAARARGARRLAVRRRDAARSGRRRRRGAGRPRAGRHPAPLSACGQLLGRVGDSASVSGMTKPPLADVPIRSADELTARWAAAARPAGLRRPQPLADVARRRRPACCRSSSRSTTSRGCPTTRCWRGCSSVHEGVADEHLDGGGHLAMALCRPGRPEITEDDDAWVEALSEVLDDGRSTAPGACTWPRPAGSYPARRPAGMMALAATRRTSTGPAQARAATARPPGALPVATPRISPPRPAAALPLRPGTSGWRCPPAPRR